MKKELKPKQVWRKSLIFSLKRKAVALKTMVSSQSSDAERLLAGMTAFERSWYYRAPLSSQFAEETDQSKPARKQKAPSLLSSRKRSRLPAIPVRRSTLIDIIKSKRVPGEFLEPADPLTA